MPFSDVIVNEHPLIDGKVGRLKGIIEHYDSPDLNHWWTNKIDIRLWKQ